MSKGADLILVDDVTLIDGMADAPVSHASILIEGTKIRSVAPRDAIHAPADAQIIKGTGKFAIPGLMNANVHLFGPTNFEGIALNLDRFEAIIAESAQIALRSGLTTVFDTWGPRRHLMSVRDAIERGDVIGSRIFCAGNIVGLDGPFSADFSPKALEVASDRFARRINATWVENVGRHLMWLAPEQVAEHVRRYAAKGIDFVKYASNDHFPGAFLAFSPRQQRAIVETAHAAGLSAQAHSMSVEGLHIALEAGCDLITHCNVTGPVPIPEDTLALFAERQAGAVIFPFTERGMEWVMQNVSEEERILWRSADENARRLIAADVPLLLANDGVIKPQTWASDPRWGKSWMTAPEDENLSRLATGHHVWFRAMEEKGCAPLAMLRAATINIARAYGKDASLGSIEPGKIADILLLDDNPLEAASHYQAIHCVIKDGSLVEREALPLAPVMTAPLASQEAEEAEYIPFLAARQLPTCGCA